MIFNNKTNILAIIQLPPPIHGASMMGQAIQESQRINEKFNIKYIRISSKSKHKYFKAFWQIINIICLYAEIVIGLIRNKYDLVYITPCASGLEFYKDYIVTLLTKLLHKKQIVYHFHNKGIDENSYVPDFIKRNFLKNVKVILISKNLINDISKYISPKNVYFLPNGISVYIDNNINKKNNTTEILFLSNMMKDKGVYTLLDSCKILKENGLDFHCSFVGLWYDINESDFFQYVIQNNLEECISYLGPKYGEKKYNILKDSDIFVFPSYNETFGLVLLEAMNLKLPCIGTNEGGIPDIIDNGETGYIVQKKDAIELASKISELINNKELRISMGQKGFDKFINQFTFNVFEKNLIEIFNDSTNT